MTLDAPPSPQPLQIAIASQLQELSPAAAPRPLIAAAVANNSAQVAAAALALLAMEDHPGSFEPWCRAFAHEALCR